MTTNKNNIKFRLVLLLGSLMFTTSLLAIKAEDEVSSVVWPITVNLSEMGFGSVFPGDKAEKTFTVSYSGNGDGHYTIVQKYKPKHDATVPAGYQGTISDYCQANHEDYDRCYKNLCPFLTVSSKENEGDTMQNASVGSDDLSDIWAVALNTPMIGEVTQDSSGIVSSGGDYGCDLSFNVTSIPNSPVCGNGTVETGEECDDGNNKDGDGCSLSCKLEKCFESDTNTVGKAPDKVFLDNGTDATSSVFKKNDGQCAWQNVTSTQYISMTWNFEIPSDASVASGKLKLKHLENNIDAYLEGWDGSKYVQLSTITRRSANTEDEFDITSFIKSYGAQTVKLRMRLTNPINCHECLDWAYLEIKYNKSKSCSECGNGKVELGEQCDDGNDANNDGCSNSCTINKGSISGCKYNDKNGNGKIDCGEEKLGEWEIQLVRCPYAPLSSNPINLADKTLKMHVKSSDWSKVSVANIVLGSDGNSFANTYTFDVKAHLQSPTNNQWIELNMPLSAFEKYGNPDWAAINMALLRIKDDGTSAADMSMDGFGYYTSSSSQTTYILDNTAWDGYYIGTEGSVSTTDYVTAGNSVKITTVQRSVYNGISKNLSTGSSAFLSKSTINTNPPAGLTGYCSVVGTTTTGADGCYSFAGLDSGDYGVNEVGKKNWIQTLPESDTYYYFHLPAGSNVNDINFLNHYEEIPEPVCGNGKLESGEECDDGNRTNGDGCSCACKIELPVCGNGKIETGEECDDGNTTSNDGCSNVCKKEAPVCGNGRIETGEECDDGNTNNNDGCSSACKKESTGGCTSNCGGGGGGPVIIPRLKITNEHFSNVTCDSAEFTWLTSLKADSRVVCSKTSVFLLGAKPDYGYTFSSSLFDADNKITGHNVTLYGFEENTVYYCRAISTKISEEAVSSELIFRTSKCTTPITPPTSQDLYIYDLTLQKLQKTSVGLKWKTNINGTTCLVYSKASKFLGEKPKYGYEWNIAGCWDLSKQNISHLTTVGGLEPCTTYYFRLTSTNGTLDAVTDEQQVKTLCETPYKPITYIPSTSTTKPATSMPAEEPGEVQAAEAKECPTCPTCQVCEICEECEKCQDTVKIETVKEKYMDLTDWLILFLILVATILLINALRNRKKKRDESMFFGEGNTGTDSENDKI